jgi:DNA-binding CsgD family transcriptional regulator
VAPDGVTGLRRTIFDAGLTAVAAAAVYALVLVLLQGGWAERGVGVAVTGLFLALVPLRAHAWETASRWPLSVVAAGALIGMALAALGGDSRLLWLPAMLLLGTSAAAVPAPAVGAAGLLAALGAASPLVLVDGLTEREQWLTIGTSVGLVVLPLAGAAIIARLDARVRGTVAAPVLVTAEALTPRQREVVGLAASGLRHAEIAAELAVSVHQVRRLLREARERTGARTSQELVARYSVPKMRSPASPSPGRM